MNIDELQDLIHKGLAEALLAKLRSGEATASDLNVARQYLKDNGVTGLPAPGTPLQTLTEVLPFDADEDDIPSHLN